MLNGLEIRSKQKQPDPESNSFQISRMGGASLAVFINILVIK